MGNVVTSDEWTDEERAQMAAASAEYDAAEGAVRAAEKRLDDSVEAAHAAGERMLLRLLRERNEAVAKLAAVESERAVEMHAANGSNVALDRALMRADESTKIAREMRLGIIDIVAQCKRDAACILCGREWSDDPQSHASECGAGRALRRLKSLAWFIDETDDPPGRFYCALPLASLADRDDCGREAMVREHAQRPSLVVEVPLAEMNAEEGRAIAYAMLRVCRSLDAQAEAGAEEGADS